MVSELYKLLYLALWLGQLYSGSNENILMTQNANKKSYTDYLDNNICFNDILLIKDI